MSICIFSALPFAASATHHAAQEVEVGSGRYTVSLRLAEHSPTMPDAARRTAARIDVVALSICDGSKSSLPKIKRSVREFSCWHNRIADAVSRSEYLPLVQARQNLK